MAERDLQPGRTQLSAETRRLASAEGASPIDDDAPLLDTGATPATWLPAGIGTHEAAARRCLREHQGEALLSGAERTPSRQSQVHAGSRRRPTRLVLESARSRDVRVATKMLVTKAEQVSDDGAHAAGLRL